MMSEHSHCCRLVWLFAAVAIVPLTSCNDPNTGRAWSANAKAASDTGEYWRIRCLRTASPQRREIVEQFANALKKVRGIDPSLVVAEHEEQASTLFYGRYRKIYDVKEKVTRFPDRMTKDIRLIRSLAIGNEHPFLLAEPELRSVDVEGPEEYQLTHCPGEFSLQIAVFLNDGEFEQRKEAAVQYTKLLRDDGVEAYYYHGDDGRSIVCVGHFDDADEPFVRQADGSWVLGPRIQEFIAQRDEFQYNLYNSHIRKTRKPGGEFMPDHSFLVPVPKPSDRDSEQWGWEPSK